MEITKIGNFTEEEFEALKAAGHTLGALRDAFKAGDVNLVTAESRQLILGLEKVINDVLDFIPTGANE